MNSFIFKTADIKSAREIKSSLKPKPEIFSDIFPDGELKSVAVSASFSLGADGLLAEISVSATLDLQCSRCLKKVEISVQDSFEEFYENPPEEINIENPVREALAMMYPQKPVCLEGCDETFLKKYSAPEERENGVFSELKKINFKKKEK
ncbi:MAG: hypothetical protein GX447_07755 [Elusimicrobia bacterium]|nr:hypothetical protein [Elusimicrobiota bacterium]